MAEGNLRHSLRLQQEREFGGGSADPVLALPLIPTSPTATAAASPATAPTAAAAATTLPVAAALPIPPTFDFAAALPSDGKHKERERKQRHEGKVNRTRVVVTREEVANLRVLILRRLAKHTSIRVSTKYVTAAVAAQKGIEERRTSHIRQEILDAWPSSGEPITLEPEPLKGQQPDDGSESDHEMRE